ncbi:MAG TPA: hypothetical protein VEH27_04045 [Methylomirabilota bacterium]|nr:hypothetical protein [Methylomirabilota bacterium]
MDPVIQRALVLIATLATTATLFAADLPPRDTRADKVIDLNTKRTFPEVRSTEEWQRLAWQIRANTAVSCGLVPKPPKTDLKPSITGKVERDGYSVEKVHFQPIPGFYLAGNLYRPLGKGNGPFPGVLNPHGHWNNGRFADEKDGSVAARCINFARMGMVAFTYDMVGYNDTPQLPHRQSFLHPTNQLWNLSMMGLQTWNSIRALDFLSSLPDVDTNRLACTGESGGGTQTFILGAVDPRLALVAPIVMVSHQMQGGCVCENAPGLRVDHSNMEIAAVPAPKPQVIVSATGDWTRDFKNVEGPAIARIYDLLDAGDRFHHAIYEAPHNYNKTTRETVYGWFDHWLLKAEDYKPRPEPAYKKESDADLRVFPDGKLPEDALKPEEISAYLVQRQREQWASLLPKDEETLSEFKMAYGPAWEQSLQVEAPDKRDLIVERKTALKHQGFQSTRLVFGRNGKGDRLEGILYQPARADKKKLAILIHEEGMRAFHQADDAPKALAKSLVDSGVSVFCPQLFNPGGAADQARNYFTNFFTTYNRTDLQERVQDLATSASLARHTLGYESVVIVGQGRAGLWTVLSAPVANAIVADAAAIGPVTDEKLLARDLFSPGLRSLGDFQGAAMLALPNPTLIHNTGAGFETKAFVAAAKALSPKSETRDSRLEDAEIARWINQL